MIPLSAGIGPTEGHRSNQPRHANARAFSFQAGDSPDRLDVPR